MSMSTTRGTISNAAKADAAHQAQVAEQWRDWHAYLEAQLKLLDAQQAEATVLPSFERHATSWEAQREHAEAALKRMPAARRAVFDRERDHRREEVQRDLEQAQRATDGRPAAIDADVIEREVLQGLLHEAEGRDAIAERGVVPMGDGRWYEVHVPSLLAVPQAADYSVGEFDDPSRRKHLLLIGGLLLTLVVGMWLTWPRARQVIMAAGGAAPTVNGAAVQPWAVREVTLIGSDGAATILSTAATTEQRWPALRKDAGPVAYWRSTAMLPLELCVPSEKLLHAATVRLRSTPILPERVYELGMAAPGRPDMLLQARGADAEKGVRYGRLTAVAPQTMGALNQTVRLGGDRALHVREVSVVGRDQDITVPEQQVRVVVGVESPSDLDWISMAPTLTLPTGNALLPADTVPMTDGVELRYLAPAFTTPLDAAWTVATQGDGHDRRWRLALEPPPSRLATLRQALSVTRLTTLPSTSGSAVQLVVDLRNTGPVPLQLRPDDLVLSQGNVPLALPPIPALRAPLAPGETRTLQLPLQDVPRDHALRVTVGAERYSIRWR